MQWLFAFFHKIRSAVNCFHIICKTLHTLLFGFIHVFNIFEVFIELGLSRYNM